jgi:hypothetical protein
MVTMLAFAYVAVITRNERGEVKPRMTRRSFVDR